MIYEVVEIGDGEEIEGPTGSIGVFLEPTEDTGQVHIEEPGDGIMDHQCRVSGDTYNNRKLIKKLPYGDDGSEWTGETWAVAKHKTSDLAAVLSIAAVKVTIDSDAIASDEGWGHLRSEVVDKPESDDSVEVMVGPGDPGDKVSRSWAEDAAKTGNYDSADEFAEAFSLEIASDEEMKQVLEDEDDSSGASVFSSE